MAGAPTRRSRLRIKPAPFVVWGFILGPWAGLTVLFAMLVVSSILQPGQLSAAPLVQLAVIYALTIIVGVVICLVVELVIVTPILMAFQRQRWWWLNGWTAALIGFAIAFGIAGLFGALPPAADFEQSGRTVTVLHGQKTAAGWMDLLIGSLMVGVVGLVAAVVFRVLAVEVDPEAAP